MIGQRIAFAKANEQTTGNKQRIYASIGSGTSGFERLRTGGLPDLVHRPKFKLDRTAPVFTIGSCFARNIESALAHSGIKCITSNCVIADELYEKTGVGARNGALNAYTPFSMLELVRLASTPRSATYGALQVGEDEWMDMLMSGLRPLSGEELLMLRAKLYGTYQQLPNASTVIITLGYTESWFDTVDQLYVNRSPAGARQSRRHADRYEFHNASPADVQNCVSQIVEHIHGINPSAKVILTVSPVPLHGTFTHRDVISANLYSKCALMGAAVQAAQSYEFVDYYPSYELVTFSPAEQVWGADGVHVKPSLVHQVIGRFTALYFD